MNVLTFDTSQQYCSIALKVDNKLFARHTPALQLQAHTMLGLIDELLELAKIDLGSIELLCFGRGPGSFTGIRIACAIVQAFHLRLQCPVVGISGLQAIAESHYQEFGQAQVLAAIDARMSEYYLANYKFKENCMQLQGEELCGNLEQFVSLAPSYPVVKGEVQASTILALGILEYQKNGGLPFEQIVPCYIRNQVTQVVKN